METWNLPTKLQNSVNEITEEFHSGRTTFGREDVVVFLDALARAQNQVIELEMRLMRVRQIADKALGEEG